MRWWEAVIRTSEEAADSVTEMLLELGAAGVSSEDPDDVRLIALAEDQTHFFDPAFLEDLPDYVTLRAYFPEQNHKVRFGVRLPDDEKLTTPDVLRLYDEREYMTLETAAFTARIMTEMDRIGQYLSVEPNEVKGGFIDEQDWADGWRKYYQTIKVSDRVVVKPSWREYKPLQGEVVINLDPGSAFGTGSHETTRLSLEALDEFMPPAARVLDVGTGSGILAIGAALLGARRVDACDIDPHAVEVAAENARINQAEDKIHVFTGELKDAPGVYDIIVANLLADVHIKLAGDIAPKLADLGLFMACGIIGSRADDVIRAFEAAGLGVHQVKTMNDWYMILFHKI